MDKPAETAVRVHEVADRVAGVQHRGVVLPAQLGADRRKRGLGQVAAQVHRNLTGLHDLALACLRQEEFVGDAEIVADRLLDAGDGDR